MLPAKVMSCFPVFGDNQGAVQLAQKPVTNSSSEHIDVRHYFLRELVRQRDIKAVQVPSKFQHADILTKAFVNRALPREVVQAVKVPTTLDSTEWGRECRQGAASE